MHKEQYGCTAFSEYHQKLFPQYCFLYSTNESHLFKNVSLLFPAKWKMLKHRETVDVKQIKIPCNVYTLVCTDVNIQWCPCSSIFQHLHVELLTLGESFSKSLFTELPYLCQIQCRSEFRYKNNIYTSTSIKNLHVEYSITYNTYVPQEIYM